MNGALQNQTQKSGYFRGGENLVTLAADRAASRVTNGLGVVQRGAESFERGDRPALHIG